MNPLHALRLLHTTLVLCALSACASAPTSTPTSAAPEAASSAMADADAIARRGHALAEKNDLSAALPVLDEALRLNPDHARARFDRAMIRLVQGQHQQALIDVDRAVQLQPSDSRLLGAQCVIRVAAGQVESGLASCQQALAIKQMALLESNALIARGQAYLLLKRLPDARVDFEEALRLSPSHMRALYGRGVVRRQLGDVTGGQADIDEALKRLPGAGREFTKAMGT